MYGVLFAVSRSEARRGAALRLKYTDVPWEWDADQRTGMPARGEEGGIESMMDGLLLDAEPAVGLTEPLPTSQPTPQTFGPASARRLVPPFELIEDCRAIVPIVSG